MSDSEVTAALNVLKRHGLIDSILFYDGITNQSIYLPDIITIIRKNQAVTLYSNRRYPIGSFNCGDVKEKRLRDQWKQAKLAVAFL